MTVVYRIRSFDPNRQLVCEEEASATSEAEARTSIASAGRVLLSVERSRVRQRPSGFDTGDWCREVSTLLKAGMTVVEALETLQMSVGDDKRVEGDLLVRLRRGEALSKAMIHTAAFPDVLIAGVASSERTGALIEALDDFLKYDALLAGLRRKVISAAIYPAAVVGVGILVSLFLLVYVIPRFSRMYVDFKGAVSLPTQILMSTSAFLAQHGMWLTAVTIAALVCSVVCLRGVGWKAMAMAALRGIPYVNRQCLLYARAKLYHSLGLMVRGGYPIDEALGVCEALRLDPAIDAGISSARTEISQGKSVSSALHRAGLADVVAHRLLAVGERGGQFDKVLQTIAARDSDAFAMFVERTARLVEPLLLLLVAVAVGGIVVMMYMPIFDIASGVR